VHAESHSIGALRVRARMVKGTQCTVKIVHRLSSWTLYTLAGPGGPLPVVAVAYMSHSGLVAEEGTALSKFSGLPS